MQTVLNLGPHLPAEIAYQRGGLAISGGVIVSPPTGTPSLVVDKSGGIYSNYRSRRCLRRHSASSQRILTLFERWSCPAIRPDLHPRTGLGLSADNQWLYIVVVDGRRYSRQEPRRKS